MDGQNNVGKNKKYRKAEKCQQEWYFVFLSTVWGGFMLFVRHTCFWGGRNGEIIWRRWTISVSHFAVTLLIWKTSFQKIKIQRMLEGNRHFFLVGQIKSFNHSEKIVFLKKPNKLNDRSESSWKEIFSIYHFDQWTEKLCLALMKCLF